MRKRQLLICSDWFFPAYKAGGPIRSVLHLAELLSPFLDVWVLTSSVDLGDEPIDVETNKWKELNGFRVKYVSSSRAMVPEFLSVMKEVNPDILYLNSVFSWRYAVLPLLMNNVLFRRRVVLAPRGMLGDGALRGKQFKKQTFLFLSKIIGLYRKVIWHASTSLESAEVSNIFPRAITHVAKNIPVRTEDKAVERTFEEVKLLFVGRISKKKNIGFALRVLERMSLQKRIQLRIVGPKEDEHYVRELVNIANKNSKLTVSMEGSLNHEGVAQAFREAHFMVLPTLHENFGHVIVESWAYGCPVVISTNTPWRDLTSKGLGWDLPLEDAAWEAVFGELESMSELEWSRLSGRCRNYFQQSVFSSDDERANLALFDP